MLPDEIEEFLESHGADGKEAQRFDEAWFEPEAGLQTMSGLRNYLLAHPDSVENSVEIARDLELYQTEFAMVAAKGAKWHFCFG